jgi:Lectin C-type domain
VLLVSVVFAAVAGCDVYAADALNYLPWQPAAGDGRHDAGDSGPMPGEAREDAATDLDEDSGRPPVAGAGEGGQAGSMGAAGASGAGSGGAGSGSAGMSGGAGAGGSGGAGASGSGGAGASGSGGAGASGSGGAGGAAGGGGDDDCPEPGGASWSQNGHCYFPLAELRTWNVSRDGCVARAARLVSVTSAAEQQFVSALVGTSSRWLGLSRFGSPTFSWLGGEAVSYTNWESGAPSVPNESAALIRTGTHAWFDASPSAAFGAICERAPSP